MCDLIGFVGDGELRILVDAPGPPQASQGEAGGRRRAGWMGRGQRGPVQLHPCRSDARHGLSQECMYDFLCISQLASLCVLYIRHHGCDCCFSRLWDNSGHVSFVLVLGICVAPVDFDDGSNVMFYSFLL